MTLKYPIKITIGHKRNYEEYSFNEFSITGPDVKVETELIDKQYFLIKESSNANKFGEIRLNSEKYIINHIWIQRKDGLEINGHKIELQLAILGIANSVKI